MKKPRLVDEETEKEIDQMATDQDEVILPQPKIITPSTKIHTVDLDSVIKFESKRIVEKKENEENGKEDEGNNISKSRTSDSRSTPLPQKERRKWYDTIY
jgi:hypothetical protein